MPTLFHMHFYGAIVCIVTTKLTPSACSEQVLAASWFQVATNAYSLAGDVAEQLASIVHCAKTFGGKPSSTSEPNLFEWKIFRRLNVCIQTETCITCIESFLDDATTSFVCAKRSYAKHIIIMITSDRMKIMFSVPLVKSNYFVECFHHKMYLGKL